nr:hypothetical protein Iba_chr12fCG12420 [Ipomoea batatas]
MAACCLLPCRLSSLASPISPEGSPATTVEEGTWGNNTLIKPLSFINKSSSQTPPYYSIADEISLRAVEAVWDWGALEVETGNWTVEVMLDVEIGGEASEVCCSLEVWTVAA